METNKEMVEAALASVEGLPVLEAVRVLRERQAEAEQVAADCACEIELLKEQQ
jgi:hypothetical protein